MNRILKLPNGKTPATPETPAMRDAFANSVAALRKATGTTEARIVPCRCAMTGQPFSLRFERLSPVHRFQIARIDKDDGAAGQVNTGIGLYGRKPLQNSYDAGEFDWTGFQCPTLRQSVRPRLLQSMRRNRLRRPGAATAGWKQGFRLP